MNRESLVEKYLGITNYHAEKIPLPPPKQQWIISAEIGMCAEGELEESRANQLISWGAGSGQNCKKVSQSFSTIEIGIKKIGTLKM